MADFATIFAKSGYSVDFFHPHFLDLTSYFPDLHLKSYPEDLLDTLLRYDEVFVEFFRSPLIFTLDRLAKEQPKLRERLRFFIFPEQKKHVTSLSSQDLILSPKKLFLTQMREFAFARISRRLPERVSHAPTGSLVIIHPFSARESKNWKLEKFEKLGKMLSDRGFTTLFCCSPKEAQRLKNFKGTVHVCASLKEWFEIMQKASYFIGNDSGPGHLASFFQIPTLVLISRKSYLDLWKPGFNQAVAAILPAIPLPNIKGLRLRERLFSWFISEKKVLRTFLGLVNLAK